MGRKAINSGVEQVQALEKRHEASSKINTFIAVDDLYGCLFQFYTVSASKVISRQSNPNCKHSAEDTGTTHKACR